MIFLNKNITPIQTLLYNLRRIKNGINENMHLAFLFLI